MKESVLSLCFSDSIQFNFNWPVKRLNGLAWVAVCGDGNATFIIKIELEGIYIFG